MARSFDATDEGKKVLTAEGDMVGRITGVSGSTAHVKADQDISTATRRRLGWAEDDDMFELDNSHVDSISDDEVHLKKDL